MANSSYANGSVTVTTTATKVCTVPAENDDVIVQTGSGGAVIFGGPSVTATTGISVPASTIQRLPSIGGTVHDLYAIVASTSTAVTFLYPEV